MATGNIPREIYIFGILIFYVVFGLIYVAVGNTLSDLTQEELPGLEDTTYSGNTLPEETKGLLGFVKTGINGYSESDNLEWVNYVFIILSALLVLLIIMLLIHG